MKLLLDIAIPAITFVLLGAVGLDLRVEGFRRVARQPGVMLAGLLGPVLLLPLLALGLLAIFRPPPAVAAGLLLIAACPIGGISNTYSMLARASTALSVALTGISCVLATITIPASTLFFSWAVGNPLSFGVPARTLALQVLLVLALPVGLGMVVRHRWPGVADDHQGMIRRVGFLALGLLILLVMYDQWAEFGRDLRNRVSLAASFVVLSFLAGWLVGRVVRCDARDQFTLAAEFATRNVAIATAIAVTILGRVDFAVFATTYFLTETPLLVLAVVVFRTGEARGWFAPVGSRRPSE
jgi:BASS family bile acid:Na+ symporter